MVYPCVVYGIEHPQLQKPLGRIRKLTRSIRLAAWDYHQYIKHLPAMAKTYDHMFKIVMIGDRGVGKPQIMMKFTTDIFKLSFSSTIGE